MVGEFGTQHTGTEYRTCHITANASFSINFVHLFIIMLLVSDMALEASNVCMRQRSPLTSHGEVLDYEQDNRADPDNLRLQLSWT